jgi:hypothetical protein
MTQINAANPVPAEAGDFQDRPRGTRMKITPFSKGRLGRVALALSLIATGGTTLAEDRPPGKWWIGLEAGPASVHTSDGGRSDRNGRLALALRGGIVAMPSLLVGLQLGGFTEQGSDFNDPARGEGISHAFAIAQWYPGQRREGAYLRAGGGYADHWSNQPAGRNTHGWGLCFGVGWDFSAGAMGYIGPSLSWFQARTGDMNVSALTLGLNWTYH